jgi:NodT family efflux transporter outer membrane factor (OMF) lipoprotein
MGRNGLIVGFGVVAFVGCAVGPNYQRPQLAVSERWAELPASSTRPAAQPATQPASQPTSQPAEGRLPGSVPTTAPAPDLATWWRTLSDPCLDRLIERAVSSNLSLRIAEARIREARALRDVVAGEQYPAVGSSATYSRQQTSANGQLGEVANGPLALLGADKLTVPYDVFVAGFDASWELDLFGSVRRRIEAADANTAAAIEQHRDVLVSVVAEVARIYVGLRGVQRRLAIAEENLAAQRATLDLVRSKRSVGAVPQLDVTRAAAQVALSESQIPLFERQIQRAILALSVLLKEEPAILKEQVGPSVPLAMTPAEVPIGLPADLLRRRPDIRQAERTLAAATAQVGVATADLFPRVTLGGGFNLEATKFSDLIEWDSRTYGVGPQIRWPVFAGGRIRANIRVQNARQEQALANYEAVVVAAIREVEEALVTYATEQTRRAALAECVRSGRESVELAQLGYEAGATDLLAVLDAQRTLFAAEDALAEADQTVVTSLVALYKALGGGWGVEAGGRSDY